MIEIRIYLDDKEYGIRSWPAVPRVGDHIAIAVKPAGKIATAKVTGVLWGITEASRQVGGDCVVGVDCTLSD
jgi:hypothetical protein